MHTLSLKAVFEPETSFRCWVILEAIVSSLWIELKIRQINQTTSGNKQAPADSARQRFKARQTAGVTFKAMAGVDGLPGSCKDCFKA